MGGDRPRAVGPARRAGAGALLLVAACASLPPPPAGDHAYTGRFALTLTGAGDSRDTTSGRFALAVSGPQATLDLDTPMGSTLARIETGPAGATLSVPAAGGPRVVRGSDVERLSEQVLGWRLPVGGLPDWIEGRPGPDASFRTTRADDGTQLIEQSGWLVRIEGGEAPGRVRRLVMSRGADARGGAPAIELRIAVDPAQP